MMFSRLFRPKTTRIELHLTDAQITKLRELMDALPLSGYADLVAPVLKALPLDHESDAGTPSGADARPAQNISESGRGFSVTAMTPRGKARMPEIEALLKRLPHVGGDL